MGKAMPGQRPAGISLDELDFLRRMEYTTAQALEEHPDYDIVQQVTIDLDRNPSEELLLVLREPHVVRSLEATGLRWNETTKRVKMGLSRPPDTKEYAHEFLQMESRHRLCLPCRDAFNYYCKYKAQTPPTIGAATEGWPNSVIHHHNLASLMVTKDIFQCDLCRQLATSMLNQYPDAFDYANVQRYHIEMCWRSKKSIDNGKIYFAMVESGTKKGTYNFNHIYILDVWSALSHTTSFTLPFVADDAYTYTMDSPTARRLAMTWLDRCLMDCDSHHGWCNANLESYVPTRVLDVAGSRATGMLCLVLTSQAEKEAFVTLSHCWGHNVQPILTTQNLEERCKSGISIDLLPKTFRDAITVAQWFNVKWLWIDCLCIIQDSKEDWLHEAKMMAPTYRQALFNISADATEAGANGLFQPRQAAGYVPLSFTATELDQTIRLTPSSVNQFAWIYDAPTFSRAWVHRERQLSRRILHFTDEQMIWECCGTAGHGFASDMIPGEPLTSRAFGVDNKQHIHGLQEARKGDLARDEDELHDSWDDVCHNISRKRLTVLTDMPIVLSSLAQDFAALLQHKDQYLSGLWRWTLPRNLLWKTEHRRRLGSHSYIAPTWSWMSTACSTTFDARKSGWSDIVYDVAEFQGVELQHNDTDDSFGPLSRGVLKLRGYLRMLRFTFYPDSADGPEKSCILSVLDDDQMSAVGVQWNDRTGDLFELKLDKTCNDQQLDCACFFISTKFWGSFEKCWQDISALLLTRSGQDEWQRIGMITFKDFYSLHMRYVTTKRLGPKSRTRLWTSKHRQLKEQQTAFWETHKAMKDSQRSKDEVSEEREPEAWVQEPDPDDLYAFDAGLDIRDLRVLEPQTIFLV